METQEEVMTNMESNSINHDDNEDREFESSPFRTENDKEDQSQHDHGQIVKGKRTKRQRPQSPIPFHLSSLDSSPASSAAEELPATTEEEKDMANCLILLARGRARPEAASSRRPSVEVGLYVYECKTCSRTFPSFQALGGHRASHKKPKLGGGATATAKDDKKHHHFVLSDEEGGGGQHHQPFKRINNNSIPSLSLQLDGIRSNKLHECSICGAEFMSGQALGGHMRRHRGPVTTPAATANTALTLTPMATEEAEKTRAGGGGGGGGLTLDLNLPAAAEDESSNRESAFAFASKQQKEQLLQQEKQQKQPHLVFSTPTLVDCHY